MSSPDNTDQLPWLTVYKGFDIVCDGCGLVAISSGGEIVAWATDQRRKEIHRRRQLYLEPRSRCGQSRIISNGKRIRDNQRDDGNVPK